MNQPLCYIQAIYGCIEMTFFPSNLIFNAVAEVFIYTCTFGTSNFCVFVIGLSACLKTSKFLYSGKLRLF